MDTLAQVIAQQRNTALDAVAQLTAQLIEAQKRIRELEAAHVADRVPESPAA